ncbi:L,D-transpeptidase [Mesorhizobium sp. LHD-90]|uniref:L,D-transpeptidase family protein n=1 Tax=Mesorhizobium sp. LHD-90 TaxID=3071414 RepID=UPI0027E175B6|nr:L,D-transpeptidase [Mesorhizobium sp. LHD-90]MDQ6432847.1 L,D-transpeptidase [Mesorhizobium sp. LHD-90]
MFRGLIFVPAMAIGFAASAAAAAESPAAWVREEARPVPAQDEIRLAQYRQAEVYYDGNGNRVIVDAVTGEVIAVQPGGLNARRERMEERRREIRRQDRYYLDDPEDMARLRRDEGWVPLDDGYAVPDYQQPDYVLPDDDYRSDEFPQAPPPPQAEREVPPVTARGDTIERRPLDDQRFTSVEPGDGSASDPDITGTVEPRPDTTMQPSAPPALNFTAREDVAAIQVLMDRAGASPGVIDGKFGSNVDKALAAYRELTGTNLKSTDTVAIKAALAASGGDAFSLYEITPEDAAGPFVAAVPADYGEKARLEHMSFTSVTEMLAERFHMDENYLKALNPEANFSRPGTLVRVANFGSNATTKVTRIIADKGQKQVRAYDADDRLVVAYPATIGSADTPSPTGMHAVSRVAINPNYTYNPKLNFKQGENDKVLTIPPGPNGPVGSVWIALDKPTYGIHGTPDPSKIGKTESHGCVRLTNWDAQELAKLVSAGVMVEFVE